MNKSPAVLRGSVARRRISVPMCDQSTAIKGVHSVMNNIFLLYILEKNDINKTCRSCFAKMFLFVKIFCQP